MVHGDRFASQNQRLHGVAEHPARILYPEGFLLLRRTAGPLPPVFDQVHHQVDGVGHIPGPFARALEGIVQKIEPPLLAWVHDQQLVLPPGFPGVLHPGGAFIGFFTQYQTAKSGLQHGFGDRFSAPAGLSAAHVAKYLGALAGHADGPGVLRGQP